MKSDGTLDALVEKELKAYFESDPEAKDLPTFENAPTIYIGITGDIPPMDFVASNGKPAGFNVALLTEIANRAQVNFEMVQIESGSRAIALSSGKVDAVFWTKSGTCTVCDTTATEGIEGTIITESYFSDNTASINLKSDK
jgi:ABC-type amino acid transport substrate-binding protein